MDDGKNSSNIPNAWQNSGRVLSYISNLYSIAENNSLHGSNKATSVQSAQELGMTEAKMDNGRKNIDVSSVPESYFSSNEAFNYKGFDNGGRPNLIRQLSGATLTDVPKSKLSTKLEFSKYGFGEDFKVTIHISEAQIRQNYLLKLCQALMAFGAPTHRLEEHLITSARVLEVRASFLYIPGCMIVSFDDDSTQTNEVKLVKVVQGVSLGLLVDIHKIYKGVIHDKISVEEASQLLDKINNGGPIYNPWLTVIFCGLASAFVSPWAFQGRFIDMPVCFVLGCIVGILQIIVAPKSELYNNLFEIAATIITSFLARAVGSFQNGSLFCFSAMAQSALALMLPGYIVLNGCLEMQSKSMVAGGVRVVYGLIITFFLEFGISIGTALYGILDPNASNATTCDNDLSDPQKWIFVPLFALFAGLANQARLKQTPVMMAIAFAGFMANFLSRQKYPASAQISNTIGAFTVGLLGNILSRVQQGVAAAALLPSILVLVPSGIAASGSLISGLHSADIILNNDNTINGTSLVSLSPNEDLTKIVASVGNTMIQLAVGITVGLFLSTLLVYPFGKKRSSLFAY
ncbi:putative duf1212 domain membrane protein prm10 [Erysiphe necator]|uniref:Putative duf1212 domain membrane protein prm10 n=1 Tax=Uncinula necator TaxID=52586 RepID=A0A0B1PCH0_UNCNE|nr:putative duf1212 domain membrane protein prm10 [Erysiphe necator]